MGNSGAHWVQLRPPKTYKQKYERLKELIYLDHQTHKDSKEYRRAYECLSGLIMAIDCWEGRR